MADTESPADRNKGPIFAELVKWLDQNCRVLEIGAGEGKHACHALEYLPSIYWQTSEVPGPRLDVLQHQLEKGVAQGQTLPPPLALDVLSTWPCGCFDAIYAANVAHIMSWTAVKAMLLGVGHQLENGGLFFLYGPFFEMGKTPGAGNQRFDHYLRQQDPGMGIHYIEHLQDRANQAGLNFQTRVAMPANNELLIWRR